MRRSAPYVSSYSFGPGPLSSAMKALIGANVVVFLLTSVSPGLEQSLGFMPERVIRQFQIWQLATYMFVHAPAPNFFHLLFNMLALWMFGTELERTWGTRYFLKFYFVTGIGAAILTVLFSLMPFSFAQAIYGSVIIGASGAIFGLLLAYAMYFPERRIYMYFLFPLPARTFVAIIGAIELFTSISGVRGGIANATHLGGLLVAYLYLKSARMDPLGEMKYRYLRWKINRGRKKFDVYSGGRADDWDRRIH